jgi:hypothetical protein
MIPLYGLTWGEFFGFVLAIFGVSIFVIAGTYFSMPSKKRIKKLRQRYARLPDGPQKEALKKYLDRIEEEGRRTFGGF